MRAKSYAEPLPHPKAADYLIASKKCELQSLAYFLQMGRLVLCISNLIHALQRERGASNIFIGSAGKRFKGQRLDYISASNLERQHFEQALHDIYNEISVHPGSSRLLNHIACVLHDLSGLESRRLRVSKLDISSEHAISAYSDSIQMLLAVVFEAANDAVDPTIAGILVAMFNLMHGKELAGQERAVGSAGFSRGRFDDALSQRMAHLIEAQNRCFEVFANFADPHSLALWRHANASKREDEVERLRQLGCSIGRYKDLDPDLADHWFELMSQRIDELKSIEDSLESHFHTRCIEKYTGAKNSLAHQETLIASLDQHDHTPEPMLVVCGPQPEDPHAAAVQSEGVSQRFGRSIFDLVQQQAQRLQQMSDELKAAKEALEDRKTQEKAVQLLMNHRQVSNDEAHKLLRQLAMSQGKKLPDVARSIVAMAEVLT
ncbi:MAG: nitrate- and nitrite sensing domain-containing protein [Marinobacter sp.]|uniref:nitrate- and nitrite sensing domain-containing protein n=1 Tax=Marinobacter sp. TaxID=50741 RepID=UPI0034A0A56B